MGNEIRLATVLSCDDHRVTARTDNGTILAGPHLSGYQPVPGDTAAFVPHLGLWLAIGRVRTEPGSATS
jgi:hypothetical protein